MGAVAWQRWVLMPWWDLQSHSELVAWKPAYRAKGNCFSTEWRWKAVPVLVSESLRWECRGPYMEHEQFETKKEAQDMCERVAKKLLWGGRPGG